MPTASNQLTRSSHTSSEHPHIEAVLDEFRPRLRLDGADIDILSVDGGLLRLRMTGRTSACPMALALLQSCLEHAMRERIPGVASVQLER